MVAEVPDSRNGHKAHGHHNAGSPAVSLAGNGTRVELRLSYGVAGAGIFGWLSERIAAPTVRGHLRSSVHQLKRQVEHEQTRRRAASRRSGQAAPATGPSAAS